MMKPPPLLLYVLLFLWILSSLHAFVPVHNPKKRQSSSWPHTDGPTTASALWVVGGGTASSYLAFANDAIVFQTALFASLFAGFSLLGMRVLEDDDDDTEEEEDAAFSRTIQTVGTGLAAAICTVLLTPLSSSSSSNVEDFVGLAFLVGMPILAFLWVTKTPKSGQDLPSSPPSNHDKILLEDWDERFRTQDDQDSNKRTL